MTDETKVDMDKPITLDRVRAGLQKLFDAGPGIACNSFPLAEWIEAIDAHLAREASARDAESLRDELHDANDAYASVLRELHSYKGASNDC